MKETNDPKLVQLILDHSNLSTTMIYNHLNTLSHCFLGFYKEKSPALGEALMERIAGDASEYW